MVAGQSIGSAPGLQAALEARGGVGYLVIHAVQFGAQPMLVKSCISHEVPTSSLVLSAEIAKIVGCLAVLRAEGRLAIAVRGWTLRTFVLSAGVPSATYLVQNVCTQVAYRHLDGVTFNILNQTKMLFTAVASFFIVGRRQSLVQCVALSLVCAAGALAASDGATVQRKKHGKWALGAACAAIASALSGLGSALVEQKLQKSNRDSYLLSAEMASLGCVLLLGGLAFNLTPDSNVCRREGLFAHWTPLTIFPVLTQGLGGIVVGLITKVAGGVRKGFAVVCGIIFTCVLRWALTGEAPSPSSCAATPLVALSIYLHTVYPPKPAHTTLRVSGGLRRAELDVKSMQEKWA